VSVSRKVPTRFGGTNGEAPLTFLACREACESLSVYHLSFLPVYSNVTHDMVFRIVDLRPNPTSLSCMYRIRCRHSSFSQSAVCICMFCGYSQVKIRTYEWYIFAQN